MSDGDEHVDKMRRELERVHALLATPVKEEDEFSAMDYASAYQHEGINVHVARRRLGKLEDARQLTSRLVFDPARRRVVRAWRRIESDA